MASYSNHSVSRALSLLRHVADSDGGLRLTELAEAAGLPVATAFRHAQVLEQAGYFRRDAAHGRYQLGLAALALAPRDPARGLVTRAAGPLLASLRRDFNGIVHVAVLRGGSLYHVDRAEVGPPVLAQSCVGRAFDPFASVAGHALLATAQAPRRAGLLAALHPARRRAAQHDIARADRAIGRDGYFHGALGCVSQMLCVALPMTASEENYALCVTAPAVRRDGEILPALIERSADVARRVARLLQ